MCHCRACSMREAPCSLKPLAHWLVSPPTPAARLRHHRPRGQGVRRPLAPCGGSSQHHCVERRPSSRAGGRRDLHPTARPLPGAACCNAHLASRSKQEAGGEQEGQPFAAVVREERLLRQQGHLLGVNPSSPQVGWYQGVCPFWVLFCRPTQAELQHASYRGWPSTAEAWPRLSLGYCMRRARVAKPEKNAGAMARARVLSGVQGVCMKHRAACN